MEYPFPGMDPYLEAPLHWESVHGQIIAGLPHQIGPQLPKGYSLSLGLKIYALVPGDRLSLRRPDLAVRTSQPRQPSSTAGTTAVLEREVMIDQEEEVKHYYLQVKDQRADSKVITVVEVLSPTNKIHPVGREEYLMKRGALLASATSLVEIDLLRAGPRMPVRFAPEKYDYSILISRGGSRPSAGMIDFSVRESIPTFGIPLQAGDPEPEVDLNPILRGIYVDNRCWEDIDYRVDPVPPLDSSDREWADALLRAKGLR